MTDIERQTKIKQALSDPRDQKDEVRALQDALYVLGGKWRLPIMNALCNGHKRFREIERSIPGITTRMLSRELKEMEMNKLITRTVFQDAPGMVEYTATGYCLTFGDIILELIIWGKQHRELLKNDLEIMLLGN